MYKLLYTDNIQFEMSDWAEIQIREVFAGTDCIMAITDKGKVLQKTIRPSVAARTEYWTRITEIALSKCMEGMAIGLVSDGTCMISKRAIREYDRDNRFDIINNQIKSWTDIVQVAASDAFFGLDRAGNVHCAPIFKFEIDDYCGVEQWKNVKRIVTGSQNSIFAVTAEGNVLAEGSNCRRGANGDLSRYFSSIKDVVDIFPTGSECEQIFMLLKNGEIINLHGDVVNTLTMPLIRKNKVLDGTFRNFVLANDSGKKLISLCEGGCEILSSHSGRIVSFAAGDVNYGQPFTIAVAEYDGY